MSRLRSSLAPETVNRLPRVYHRPQEGSGVVLKGGPAESFNRNLGGDFSRQTDGKRILNTAQYRGDEYDNPNRNMMRDFDAKNADNLYQVQKLVVAYNHSHGKDAALVGQFRIDYYASLEDCNLCYMCKKPIKVKRARIDADSRVEGAFTNPKALVKTIDANGARRIRSITSPQSGKLEFSSIRFKPVGVQTNKVYADVRCHFEFVVYRNANGEKKYRYQFVDGTKRNIQFRKGRYGLKELVVIHPNGETEKLGTVPHTYRVENKRCDCKR